LIGQFAIELDKFYEKTVNKIKNNKDKLAVYDKYIKDEENKLEKEEENKEELNELNKEEKYKNVSLIKKATGNKFKDAALVVSKMQNISDELNLIK
jgi:hypothetical protein